MNANEENAGQPHKADQSGSTDESVIHAVARAAGSAIGEIASAVAKVASGSHSADPQPGEVKLQPKRHSSPRTSERSGDKYSQARLASKKRKKMAHRRVLRRSHANG